MSSSAERRQTQRDVTGFEVEATDGSIGKVDEATYDTGRSYLVVDTGPWIFGKKVMLPAGIVHRIDVEEQKVFVDRTKDEIRQAPEYDESLVSDDSYHVRLRLLLRRRHGIPRSPDCGTRPPDESLM